MILATNLQQRMFLDFCVKSRHQRQHETQKKVLMGAASCQNWNLGRGEILMTTPVTCFKYVNPVQLSQHVSVRTIFTLSLQTWQNKNPTVGLVIRRKSSEEIFPTPEVSRPFCERSPTNTWSGDVIKPHETNLKKETMHLPNGQNTLCSRWRQEDLSPVFPT